MSDPMLGLTMLVLIVVVIVMGFPTAFTLMGLGIVFGFIAFYDPSQFWWDNRVFELMVQRTYGAMTNDVLIAIPLFVLMGYVMERGALVDKMFYSIQLAFRRVPASLAVATLIVCTFWGIASGLVGAVVVLMGVIAMNPMLRAGYDVKLAAGVITAGGTLGILIPPSVMIIVYAAVAGQSVVKLYAAAMLPGFLLAFLYLVYIVGWAMLRPKIAPRLPEEQTRVPVPAWMRMFQSAYSPNMFFGTSACAVRAGQMRGQIDVDGKPISYGMLLKNFAISLVPFVLIAGTLWLVYWYIIIHQQAGAEAAVDGPAAAGSAGASHPGPVNARRPKTSTSTTGSPLVFGAIMIVRYYWNLTAERFELLKLLTSSVMPLGILTVVVLGVILFGITTATESAGVGAAGAFLLALACPHAQLEAHQGSGVPDRQDHRHGVLAVRRLGAVLRRVRAARRAGAARAMGAVAQPDAGSVHDPVAGDHLPPGMAAGVDRDHHHLRADLPADAPALRHRPDPVGRAGVHQPAGGIPVAAGGDVGLLSEGRRALACDAQSDFLRHDAVYADRHPVHGAAVSVARAGALAAGSSSTAGDAARRHCDACSNEKRARRLLFAPSACCPDLATIDYAALGGTPSVSLKNAIVRPQARSAAALS